MPQPAFDLLRRGYLRDPDPSLAERVDRLVRLEHLLVDEAERFVTAIDADFGGRSRTETLLADIATTLDSVRHARRHLRGWMRPERVDPHPVFRPSRGWVERVPKGVVGIIAPWNYPVNLALGPMVAALAAGNRVLLKPSEVTPRTAALLGRALRDRFTAEEVAVVEGNAEVARAVTSLPLDHLFFTGSTAVGTLVAQAAAASLVPVTLELGGKSPVLVTRDAPMAHAAARVAVGKLFNAGQTCIAPDYVLLPRGKLDVFVAAFRDAVERMGPSARQTAVISDRAHARLLALLAEAEAGGATLEHVGSDGAGRRMAPVLVLHPPAHGRLLTEELFGPVLPILEYDSLDTAIRYVQGRPRPLAFYVFEPDVRRAESLLRRVVSGGASINDTLVHFGQENLPFGGVGQSGVGAYHGRAGFDSFSHIRGVLSASAFAPARHLLAPPYGRLLEGALAALRGPLGRLTA
ncbi:aldehyde dehydrogenase [Deltaproteobacteria bacterium]|nr:aldehyde dehydrogenase [Deltaproteobacteria bacterium]